MPSPVEIAPGLLAWIDGLRVRLRRGELAGLGPIEASGCTLPDTEGAVRVMLADLDHHAHLSPRRREQPELQARYRALLDDFRDLKGRIG